MKTVMDMPMIELSDDDLDAVAAGVGVFGAAASEVAQTFGGQALGTALHEQGGFGTTVQGAQENGLTGRDLGQAIAGR